jgi:hypothetical protein
MAKVEKRKGAIAQAIKVAAAAASAPRKRKAAAETSSEIVVRGLDRRERRGYDYPDRHPLARADVEYVHANFMEWLLDRAEKRWANSTLKLAYSALSGL